jgi:cytochrome subunit of sulfide dehydrogenase
MIKQSRIAGVAAAISAVGLLMSVPVQAQDLSKIRYMAANCANCHGTEGRSVGGIASLAGYSRDQFIRTMTEYKEGKRPASIMHQISKGYTDEQIAQLGAYFAAQRR